jgi:hypothetical protein
MKTFDAIKTYHVHEFTAIQDWFGNRGIAIAREDLTEWCYDGYFLYILPSASADEMLHPVKEGCEVVTLIIESECIEICDEMTYNQSPFARKIKQ